MRTSAKNPNSIPNSIDSRIPYDRKSFPFNVHERLCHNLERSQTILRGNRSYVYAWPTYRNLITVLWSGGYRSRSTIVLISASPINWSIIRTERSKRNRPGCVCVACEEAGELLRKSFQDYRKLVTSSACCSCNLECTVPSGELRRSWNVSLSRMDWRNGRLYPR